MEKFRVGIIGATGMVGQRFVLLTANHPWFTPVVLAASAHSAGKPYVEAIGEKWHMADPIPESVRSMVVMDAEADAEEIAKQVDFVFCAVNMKKDEIKALEERYARLECPVVSNNSAHRHTPDVPMVVPEINADHIRIIDAQRKRLGTKRGFIAVKSNCSLQSYVPALHPLMKYGIEKALVCTYQAISGAGKTFDTWPEMLDNVIPYIGGEEEKSLYGCHRRSVASSSRCRPPSTRRSSLPSPSASASACPSCRTTCPGWKRSWTNSASSTPTLQCGSAFWPTMLRCGGW